MTGGSGAIAQETLTKRRIRHGRILNLAIPYFGLIFIGFACGKTSGLPEAGLAWMNFFLLYVSPRKAPLHRQAKSISRRSEIA